jgi:dTDP-L-rhamnose 4-epimerase
MKSNRKVLVTGGAGFIGSHTVDALLERGDKVRVYDNLNPQVHGPDAKIPKYLNSEVEFIKGDVRDRDSLKKAIQDMDVIIHDAAEVGVGQSMYSIDQYISVNVQGTGILWDILVNEKHSIEKVLVASSMSLYGEGRFECEEHGQVKPKSRRENDLLAKKWEMYCPDCGSVLKATPTDEEKELDCTSVYAQSKKDQEVYSIMIGKAYQLPTVACRYFNCYGPRQSLNNPYTGAAAIFSSSIKNDKPPLIYEDGKQARDFIHVKDLVRGKLLLLDSPESKFDIYNIGTGQPTSILQLAQALIDLSGKNFTPDIIHKFRNGDIRHCFADVSKIQKLGFKPEFSLKKGLEDLSNWVEKEAAESKVDLAHGQLVEKGLVV